MGRRANHWRSAFGTLTGNVDFDLGGLFEINSMAFWNIGSNSSISVVDFTLLADDNSAFTSPTNLGSFTADTNTGHQSAVLAEVFDFATISASHFRMQITSNNGGTDFTGIGEVAFEAVPEPSTFVLALMGILMLSSHGRRRRRR